MSLSQTLKETDPIEGTKSFNIFLSEDSQISIHTLESKSVSLVRPVHLTTIQTSLIHPLNLSDSLSLLIHFYWLLESVCSISTVHNNYKRSRRHHISEQIHWFGWENGPIDTARSWRTHCRVESTHFGRGKADGLGFESLRCVSSITKSDYHIQNTVEMKSSFVCTHGAELTCHVTTVRAVNIFTYCFSDNK